MYLLDANVLITAKNSYYPFDLVPGFWTWVKEQAEKDCLHSIIQVRDELRKGDDQLAHWIRSLPSQFWLKNTSATSQALGDLSIWAQSSEYSDTAIQTFFGSADFYLAAQGKASGFTVVTHETSSTKKGRVKLPDACAALSVSVITPFEWMRSEATRFEGFGS